MHFDPRGLNRRVLLDRVVPLVSRISHIIRRVPAGSSEFLIVAVMLGFFAWLIAHLPPLPQVIVGQDLGILLDAGWRFTQGQLPHRDYVSPLGPSFSLIAGLPLVFGGPRFESYKFLPLALCAAFSTLALAVVHRRVPAAVAIVYSIATGFVAGGTYHFGLAPEGLTFATLFNRVGWAGVMVLAAAWGLPPRPACAKWRGTVDAAVAGALLAFLMFLKMNYFLVALGMMVAALVFFRRLRERSGFTTTAIAFSIVAVYLCSLMGWSLANMARDLGYAVQARKETWLNSGLWHPGVTIFSNITLLVGWSAIAMFAIGIGAWRETIFSAFVLAAGFALCNSNSSGNGFGIPLIVSAVLTLAAGALASPASSPNSWSVRVLAWGGLMVAATHAVVLPQIASFGMWRTIAAINSSDDIQAFRGAPRPLDQLVVGPMSCGWGANCVNVTREAVELVRTFVPQGKTVMYVDFTNWINFAASAKSPRGSLLWIDDMATFARAKHPRADFLFQDCDFVLIPKHSIAGSDGMAKIKAWLSLYKDYLDSRYEIVDNGSLFAMYQKREPD